MHARAARLVLMAALVHATSCSSGDGKGTASPPGVTAPAPVLSTLSVSLGASTLLVSQSTLATASGLDQNAAPMATGAVSWASSAPTVATVSAGGTVTAVAAGQAQITGSAGTRSGQATVTVLPVPVASVAVTPNTLALVAGASQQLTALVRDSADGTLSGRIVTWSTSQASIATVSATGLVTAAAAGTATITATSGGKAGTVSVAVSWPPARALCAGGVPVVAVLVDPGLSAAIDAALDQWALDMCADGWTTIAVRRRFATPVELRQFLRSVYDSTGRRLDGTVIVGDFPRAYQFVVLKSSNPSIPDTRNEVLSTQYFADLDGTFAASPGYVSPGNRAVSFDLHAGNVESELWVGVLPLYKGAYAATESALLRYWQKNYAYRRRASALPRRFLQVSEFFTATSVEQQTTLLNFMRTGAYAWTPFSDAASAQLFLSGTTITLDQGYAALSAGTADFFVGDAHGFEGAHGRLSIAWAESQSVATSFFWSNGCSVGNIDVTANFITSVLYSPTSQVVFAKGSTNLSGGMGNNTDGFFGRNIATSLSLGRPIGDAIRRHVNVPLLWPWSDSREFQIATHIFVGDPTLRLR